MSDRLKPTKNLEQQLHTEAAWLEGRDPRTEQDRRDDLEQAGYNDAHPGRHAHPYHRDAEAFQHRPDHEPRHRRQPAGHPDHTCGPGSTF